MRDGVAEVYFLIMTLGVPLAILLIALLGSQLYRGGYRKLLDWTPTRSPEREAELEVADIQQMLAAQNRYRRERGAPERSLEEVTEHAGRSPARRPRTSASGEGSTLRQRDDRGSTTPYLESSQSDVPEASERSAED